MIVRGHLVEMADGKNRAIESTHMKVTPHGTLLFEVEGAGLVLVIGPSAYNSARPMTPEEADKVFGPEQRIVAP